MSKIVGIGHRPKTEAVDTTAFENKIEKLTTKVAELETANKTLIADNETLVNSNVALTTKVAELETAPKKGDK